MCKTKTNADFLVSDRSCPKIDGLGPHHCMSDVFHPKVLAHDVLGTTMDATSWGTKSRMEAKARMISPLVGQRDCTGMSSASFRTTDCSWRSVGLEDAMVFCGLKMTIDREMKCLLSYDVVCRFRISLRLTSDIATNLHLKTLNIIYVQYSLVVWHVFNTVC